MCLHLQALFIKSLNFQRISKVTEDLIAKCSRLMYIDMEKEYKEGVETFKYDGEDTI